MLHLVRGLILRQTRDSLELLLGVLVASEDPLKVENCKPAEATDLNRRPRRYNAVHRRGHKRQLETVRTELPGDVYVVGITRASRWHDRNVIEPIGAARLLSSTDLNFHRLILGLLPDEIASRNADPSAALQASWRRS